MSGVSICQLIPVKKDIRLWRCRPCAELWTPWPISWTKLFNPRPAPGKCTGFKLTSFVGRDKIGESRLQPILFLPNTQVPKDVRAWNFQTY
jgi:hypothetical protein